MKSLFMGIAVFIIIVLIAFAVALDCRGSPDETDQIKLVAAVILHEAGGEGTTGMYAVAGVISTRMDQRGLSTYQVVTQRKQFSCLNGVTNYRAFIEHAYKKWGYELWSTAIGLSDNLHGGVYFTNPVPGANLYCRHDSWPSWRKSNKVFFVKRINNHVFYKE